MTRKEYDTVKAFHHLRGAQHLVDTAMDVAYRIDGRIDKDLDDAHPRLAEVCGKYRAKVLELMGDKGGAGMAVGDAKKVAPRLVWEKSVAYGHLLDDRSGEYRGTQLDTILDREVVRLCPVNNNNDLVSGIGGLVIHFRQEKQQ